MFRSIYSKNLYNLRWEILGWCIGLGLVVLLTMSLYNAFDQEGIENVVNAVPDSLKSIVGTADDFKTIPGYIGQQIFGPNGYILAIIASILLAFSISGNEEDDGRLQTLLTLPVTRSAVFCQKWLALITAIAVLCLAVLIGLYGGLLVVGQNADFARVMESTLAFFLMNCAFATIAFSVAMFVGKKGLSIAIVGGYAMASFIITSMAPAVSGLKFIDRFSVLHYYNNPLIMQNGLKYSQVATLILITTILATIAWIRFNKRNVGT